jgi:hypothetical protein
MDLGHHVAASWLSWLLRQRPSRWLFVVLGALLHWIGRAVVTRKAAAAAAAAAAVAAAGSLPCVMGHCAHGQYVAIDV